MEVHFGHRRSREGWWSFETHPRMERTKRRIYDRCLPCLTALLEQLKRGADAVDLPFAWDCWKVVAVAPDEETCMALLQRLAEEHPDLYLFGKVGGRRDRFDTSALVLHGDTAEDRDHLLAALEETASRTAPGVRVHLSRACADPYADLLGPWEHWTRPCPVRHPEAVPRIVHRLRELLYGAS